MVNSLNKPNKLLFGLFYNPAEISGHKEFRFSITVKKILATRHQFKLVFMNFYPKKKSIGQN